MQTRRVEDLLVEQYTLMCENIEQKLPHLVKQFAGVRLSKLLPRNISPERFANAVNEIAQDTDPTYPRAEYITWILRMIKSRSIIVPEDMPKVYETLHAFDRLKKTARFVGVKDINQYSDYAGLAITVKSNDTVVSKGEEKRLATLNGTKEIYEDAKNQIKVVEVTTPEAASKLFRNTEWCVKDPEYYAKYGPPFYMIEWENNPVLLIHIKRRQMRDRFDKALTKEELYQIPNFDSIISAIPGFRAAIDKTDVQNSNAYNAAMNVSDIVELAIEGDDSEDFKQDLEEFITDYPNISADSSLIKHLAAVATDMCADDIEYVRETILDSDDFRVFLKDDADLETFEDMDRNEWETYITNAVSAHFDIVVKNIHNSITHMKSAVDAILDPGI